MGDGGGFEGNAWQSTKVGGGDGVLTKFLRGVKSKFCSKPNETSVVISGVGVIHRCHKVRIAPIDAMAIVDQAFLDRRDCRQGLDGRQRAKDLLGSRHSQQG